MLTDRPNIVICHWRPKRSPKRRPPPPLTCGRIVEIKPRMKGQDLPRGVPDEAQRRVLIEQYLKKGAP